MHQLKQNSTRGFFHSKPRRSLKNICESNNFYSTTQTLFPSKKNSLKPNELEYLQLTKAQFYKTTCNSTNWGGWVRPQSKQGCRKTLSRPQTSKGFRKQPLKNTMFSNIENERTFQAKIKSLMPSKRKSGLCYAHKQQSNQLQNKHCEQFKYPKRQIKKQQQQLDQIEIVINKRPFNSGQKSPSVHKNKFETDLDDEFLELFAD